MGATGGFPIDLLLFGMIAAFLVLRLRSILGRRTGFERPAADAKVAPAGAVRPVLPAAADANDLVADPAARALPEPTSPAGQGLARIAAAEPAFNAGHFLGGAEAAFRLIVEAYAAGDRAALRPLLTDDTYHGFESAIAAREAAGEVQRGEIRAINTVAVEAAALRDNTASVIVRFVSDQINETLDRDGKPIAGTDAVTEITDLWTFERELRQPDPAWRLAAAQSG